jgi:hypothetical protein
MSLDLGSGFQLRGVHLEDFEGCKEFHNVELFHRGVLVLSDTTREFEFEPASRLTLRTLRDSSFEMTLVIDGQIHLLRIKSDHIINEFEMPILPSQPKDLAGDGLSRVAGCWGASETWQSEQGWVIGYDPILYYVVSDTGTYLDSGMTQKRNAEIYGKFSGYHINQDAPVPVSIHDSVLFREFARINSSRGAP